MNIYQKLLTIQKDVDSFVKDAEGFNYSYTKGSTVLNKIRPKMNELGLILKQEVTGITSVRCDYTTKNGSKSEMLATVLMRFTWVDTETGEKDENEFGATGMNDFDKGFGSALTYAERYFLLKYFHVPTDEDDVDNHKKQQPQQQPTKPWLNEGTPEFDKSKVFMQKATDKVAALKTLQQHYSISKKVQDLLK